MARNLRRQSTDAERFFWQYLRNRQLAGFKFRRQEIIGPYIVDFVCLERKLIIELDGGQHTEQMEVDANRTAFLETKGYKVMRFWNHEVIKDIKPVLEKLQNYLIQTPSPPPSPVGRGGINETL